MVCQQGSVELEYCPLKVGQTEGKIEITNNDLGNFTYDLNLHALKPNPECELKFAVSLGMVQTLHANFTNYSKNKLDYTCHVIMIDMVTWLHLINIKARCSVSSQ